MAIAINTSEDIIRALREDPYLLDQARRAILTDDLLGVPTVQKEMLEEIADQKTTQNEILKTQNEMLNEIAELRKTQGGILNEIAELRKTQNDLLRRAGNIETRFDRFEVDFGKFRGNFAEVAAVKNAIDIVIMLDEARDIGIDETSARVLSRDDLRALAREYGTAKLSAIPRDMRRSYYKTDLVIEAVKSDGSVCYIVVQASYTCDPRDTAKAIANAELISRFTNKETWPTVAGVRLDNRIRHVIENGDVFWYPIEDEELEPEDPI